MALTITQGSRAHPTLVREFSYVLEWRPEQQYIAGTQVELRGRGMGLDRWAFSFVSVSEGDVTSRWRARGNEPAGSIVRFTLAYGARRAAPMEIRLRLRPPMWPVDGLWLAVWTIAPPNPWKADDQPPEPTPEEGSSCFIPVESGPVERLSVYVTPAADVGGKVRAALVPEDRYGNPARFVAPVPVHLTWGGQVLSVIVQEAGSLELPGPDDPVGRARVAVPMSALDLSENVANGLRCGDDLVVVGNPVLSQGPGGLRPAFGAVHWHTTVSDGWCTDQDAFARARDSLNLDFAVPGDHAPMGERWERHVQGVDQTYEPGRFVTLYGGEGGSARGHTGVYSAQPDWPTRTAEDFWLRDPDKIASSLADSEQLVVVANHPAVNGLPYWDCYAWGAPSPALRLVEVLAWGNQERNDYADAWRGWFGHSGRSVQDALAMGHQVGFIGSSDNHPGWPGRLYHEQSKGLHPPKSVILTGVWTAGLDRQGLFGALRARRTWAVWDTRAVIWFSVGDAVMGEEVKVPRGTNLTARIRLWAEDALRSVEIISEGASVWGSSFARSDVDVSVPLGAAEHSSHYYVRALQRDGGMLYASPVFVTVV